MLALLLSIALPAAETPDYVRDVHPILQAHCGGCHNDDDSQGDFNVATFASLSQPLSYLGEGPSLTPGRHDTSQFYRYMAGLDEPRMPPEGEGDAVPEADLAIVRAWLDGGAPGPDGVEIDRTALVVPAIESSVTAEQIGITAMAARGRLVATARDATVTLQRDGKTLWIRDDLPGRVNDLAHSGDGETLAIATGVEGLYGQVQLVDVPSGQTRTTVQGHRDTLYAVAISPDGQTLATAGYDRRIELWNAADGSPVRTLTGHNGAVFDLAFSGDGRTLASASADETIKLWQVETGERLDTLPQPEGEQTAVFFSAGDRHVFAAGADNRIRRWKFVSKDGPKINPLQLARFAHEGPVTHLASRGPFIVSASTDRTVKVWNAGQLRQLAAHEGLADVPSSLAITGDGQIVVGLMDGQTATFALPQSATPPQRQVARIDPTLPAPATGEWARRDEAEVDGPLPKPVILRGTIAEPAEVDTYTFEAKAGEQWVVRAWAADIPKLDADGQPVMKPAAEEDAENAAAEPETERSKIDTVIEVRTAAGEPIERVVLEAVRDSYFTFRGKNSTQNDDFRIHNWDEMELNDLFFAGGEVVKFWQYPTGPDDGYKLYPGVGSRAALFDTTPVAHALGEPAYIVRPHPPGTEITGTGLPVIRLHYRNDDDATNRRGRDSKLTFTAPADGTYQVRIADARGFGDARMAYELELRARTPHFRPSVGSPDWAKKPLRPGSGREVTLKVDRVDDFAGPVRFRIANVPDGVSVPEEIVVEPEQTQAYLNLYVEPGATPSEEALRKIEIAATAAVPQPDGTSVDVTKTAGSLGDVTFAAEEAPKVMTTIHLPIEDGVPTLRIRPGETRSMRLSIVRSESFKGRVPFGKQEGGRNLPHGMLISNIGLNGLMLLEGQTEREFFVTASPITQPQERTWYLKAEVGNHLTSHSVRVIVEDDEAGEVASR